MTRTGFSEAGPVIEARDLRKSFDGTAAVDGVTFEVRRGECYGLLGPNGAGKTTTIRMVYGFSPRGGGGLRVFGLDVAREPRVVKARIGVCQQASTLDPDLTVRENLVVFARYFDIPVKEADRRADRLLAFISLDGRAGATVSELSGGLARRLMLARALINDPELLILDEPTTGLDPQSRHQLWERLEELKRKGMSILLTTHYMEEAARLADRVAIMDRGRILVEGRPRDLVRAHAGDLVIEVPDPTDDLRRHVVELGLPTDDLGHRLTIHGGGEELYRDIVARFCLGECLLRMATLEDVFLKLTGRGLRE